MKKILSFVLVFVMIFCLTACGETKKENKDKKSKEKDDELIADDFDWEYNNRELIIKGHGRMPDYYDEEKDEYLSIPWAKHSDSIEKVTIEDGITGIGKLAFSYCYKLDSIYIPKKISYIGDGAFAYTQLKNGIEVDKKNEHFCYQNGILYTKNMKKIIHSTGIVDQLNIPDSVTKIGQFAFAAKSLKEITIPGNVKTIERRSFYANYYAQKIYISEGVEVIETEAFWDCRDVETVTIPASMKKIGKNAFLGIYNLSDVYYGGTVEMWNSFGDETGFNSNDGTVIHCSDGDITITY